MNGLSNDTCCMCQDTLIAYGKELKTSLQENSPTIFHLGDDAVNQARGFL